MSDKIDGKTAVDKIYERYNGKSKEFGILFAIVLGSGVFFLLVPLGQYYFIIQELQSEFSILTNDISTINIPVLNSVDRIITSSINLNNNLSLANRTKEIPIDQPQDEIFLKKVTDGVIGSIQDIGLGLAFMENKVNQIEQSSDLPVQTVLEDINKTRTAAMSLTQGIENTTVLGENITTESKFLNNSLAAAVQSSTSLSIQQVNNTLQKLVKLIEPWKAVNTPFGSVPIGLYSLIAILPIAIMAGHVIGLWYLLDLIRIRRMLQSLYKDEIAAVIAPLWLNPEKSDKTSRMKQILTLMIPFLIFLTIIYLLYDIWFNIDPSMDKAIETYQTTKEATQNYANIGSSSLNITLTTLPNVPQFFEASESINKYMYLVLYLVSIAFTFSYSLFVYSKFQKS